jgi:hypothetical protein
MITGSFLLLVLAASGVAAGAIPEKAKAVLYPLSAVRIHTSAFSRAVDANRAYLLALEPDRLLAPFRREAGLAPLKPSYGNWESMGLDGHTCGHYLSALADMIAAGADTQTGELHRRLGYMVDQLALCQTEGGNGYVGGVPGSKAFWSAVAAGHIEEFNNKWVPWYNVHKTFAGLRDAYLVAGNTKAKEVLVRLADWACNEIGPLTDEQMRRMLGYEHGGMNEVLADVSAITGDAKYLRAAERFCDPALLGPLERDEDRLTGLHANTQIPKVIGFERIADITGELSKKEAARFFWNDVTQLRSVAFGGNSVSEHFNDPKDFEGMLEHREGPETCNTYNMLRLTEKLFADGPDAHYLDFYERALYNHILASIDPDHPGFVYFTPIRPGHYRVYSQPGEGFWCCCGTGMENPGRYGQLIYAKADDGIYVNLFIPSELTDPDHGVVLTQKTKFPDEERTELELRLHSAKKFSLYLRHPAWIAAGSYHVKVNGHPIPADSAPSSYLRVNREWRNGDRVEVSLPMRTTVEHLPDRSDWAAILHGPIVLASPTGTQDQDGLFAGAGRGDHIPNGPLVALDSMPALLPGSDDLAKHVVPDPAAGPLHFRIEGIATPAPKGGIELLPFFELQESRYQMYWDVTTKQKLEERAARVAAEEKAKLARDAATVDKVAIGEQQSEIDHLLTGEGLDTGFFNGRRWRHGRTVQFTLDTKGQEALDLSVTYTGSDNGRVFDIFANDTLLATQELKGENPGRFFEVRYPIPPAVVSGAKDHKLVIRFVVKQVLAGGLYDLRLLRSDYKP